MPSPLPRSPGARSTDICCRQSVSREDIVLGQDVAADDASRLANTDLDGSIGQEGILETGD
jgi:hypothetical protein